MDIEAKMRMTTRKRRGAMPTTPGRVDVKVAVSKEAKRLLDYLWDNGCSREFALQKIEESFDHIRAVSQVKKRYCLGQGVLWWPPGCGHVGLSFSDGDDFSLNIPVQAVCGKRVSLIVEKL